MAEPIFDPFSLLPEEEKDKLAKQALNIEEDTESDFIEDIIRTTGNFGAPLTSNPGATRALTNTFAAPISSGIRNIVPSFQQSNLGNKLRSETEDFQVETGQIQPRAPLGFGTNFGAVSYTHLTLPTKRIV